MFHKIYWFAYYNCDSPSVRYRAYYPLDYAQRKHGVETHLIIPGYRSSRILRFVISFFQALFSGKNDLIVIQRVSTNWIYSNALKFLASVKRNVAYDLDDADYLLNDPSTIYFFAKKSACIIAGSETIARHLEKFNPKVIINTSPAPAKLVTKTARNGKFVVGWIGEYGGEHRTTLMELLFPAILNFQFPVRLVLMGVVNDSDRKEIQSYFCNASHVELRIPENIDWMNEQMLQEEISKFDAGIATLANSEMHRSKSGFKVKQYLNNGVPVLCNDLRENNRFVIDAYNGFLCNSSDEFSVRLSYLCNLDDHAYAKLSRNAASSTTGFTLDNYCKTLCNLN